MPAVISKNLTSAVAIVAGSFLAVSAASADTNVAPNLTFSTCSGNNSMVSFAAADYGSVWGSPNGTFNYNGSHSVQGFDIGWSMMVNPDPFVIANFVVTNNSGADASFVLEVTMPIGAILPTSLMGGSVTGSVTDLNGNGATVSTNSANGAPIYTALIDGVGVQSLLVDPFSVSAGNFESATVGPAEFGNPIPSMAGPGVNDSIGIRLEFVLTAGDSASFTSIFVVEPVPGPGGLALIGLAGVFSRGRRRRA